VSEKKKETMVREGQGIHEHPANPHVAGEKEKKKVQQIKKKTGDGT